MASAAGPVPSQHLQRDCMGSTKGRTPVLDVPLPSGMPWGRGLEGLSTGADMQQAVLSCAGRGIGHGWCAGAGWCPP